MISTCSKDKKLISDIEEKIESMGPVLKPEKCRSLSKEKVQVENIKFKLTNKLTRNSIIRVGH